jgi:hypothetical protein
MRAGVWAGRRTAVWRGGRGRVGWGELRGAAKIHAIDGKYDSGSGLLIERLGDEHGSLERKSSVYEEDAFSC